MFVAAVSDMPRTEVDAAEDNPRLLKAQKMTGSIRWLELYRSYLLAEELDNTPRQDHNEIIDHWARNMGMTPGTLKSHLGWARSIDLQLLADSFEGEGISEQEWTQRIGTSHLKVVARARDPATDTRIMPGHMVELVVECYHGNWSVAELDSALRNRGLLPPKKGMQIAPSKLPNSAADLLELITAAVRQRDMALCITKTGSTRIAPALRRLADMLDREQPGAEFTIGGEDNAVHKGACNVLGRGPAG